jgi:hypothetical protein
VNIIHRLKAEVAARDAALSRVRQDLEDFVVLLHSQKFAGQESDGSRKDWIATADVLHRLFEMRLNLIVE